MEINEKLSILEQTLLSFDNSIKSVDSQLKIQERMMLNLSALYARADLRQKRSLISFLIPQNLAYTVEGFRKIDTGKVLKTLYSLVDIRYFKSQLICTANEVVVPFQIF